MRHDTAAGYGGRGLPVRSRLLLPGALALMLLLPACIIFPFPPPFGGESDLVIENATEEQWVLRVVATDGFPQYIAVPAGGTGTAVLFGGAPQSLALLNTECAELDELEWTDVSLAVRIDGTGELSAIDEPAGADGETFLDYPDCMGGGFGPGPEAGDPVVGASGTILFIGGEGGAWQIDAATADLQGVATTAGPTFDTEHAISPDGTTIAFTRFSMSGSSSDLFVADVDGGNERMLAEDAGQPAWSPDGTRIAYLRLDPFAGGAALNVIGLEGGEPTQLAEDASWPRWSPDGRQIAFMAIEGGFNQPVAPEASELRLVNADGTGEATLAEASPFAGAPAWSPDGSRIAVSGGSETDASIDVVTVASGEVTVLAQIDDAMLVEPAWAPDAERIAFVISSMSFLSSESAIGTVPADGGELERLGALDNAYFTTPTWSPDGEWLAAARGTGMAPTSDLVVFGPESGEETVLATGVMGVLNWRD